MGSGSPYGGPDFFFAYISNDVPYDGFTCRIGIIQHLLFYVLLLLLMDNIASNSVSISFVIVVLCLVCVKKQVMFVC